MFEAALLAAFEALVIVVEAVMRFSLSQVDEEAPGAGARVAHGRATVRDCRGNSGAAR